MVDFSKSIRRNLVAAALLASLAPAALADGGGPAITAVLESLWQDLLAIVAGEVPAADAPAVDDFGGAAGDEAAEDEFMGMIIPGG